MISLSIPTYHSDDDDSSTSTMSSPISFASENTSPTHSRDSSSSYSHNNCIPSKKPRLDYNTGIQIYFKICNLISTHTPGSYYCPDHEVVCNAGQHPSTISYLCKHCSLTESQSFRSRKYSINNSPLINNQIAASYRRSSSTPPLNLNLSVTPVEDFFSESPSTPFDPSQHSSSFNSRMQHYHHPPFRTWSSSKNTVPSLSHHEAFADQVARANTSSSTPKHQPVYYSTNQKNFSESIKRSQRFQSQYLQKGRFYNSDYFQADINYDSDSDLDDNYPCIPAKQETQIKSCLKKSNNKKNKRISLSLNAAPFSKFNTQKAEEETIFDMEEPFEYNDSASDFDTANYSTKKRPSIVTFTETGPLDQFSTSSSDPMSTPYAFTTECTNVSEREIGDDDDEENGDNSSDEEYYGYNPATMMKTTSSPSWNLTSFNTGGNQPNTTSTNEPVASSSTSQHPLNQTVLQKHRKALSYSVCQYSDVNSLLSPTNGSFSSQTNNSCYAVDDMALSSPNNFPHKVSRTGSLYQSLFTDPSLQTATMAKTSSPSKSSNIAIPRKPTTIPQTKKHNYSKPTGSSSPYLDLKTGHLPGGAGVSLGVGTVTTSFINRRKSLTERVKTYYSAFQFKKSKILN